MRLLTSLTTLALLSFIPEALAVKSEEGGPCSQDNNHLSSETKQFVSDCSPMHYCSAQSVCKRRGCRRDEFPFGYPKYSDDLPPRCKHGEFCPDEEDACQPHMPVGSLCQLNRDDQCGPPPNFKELATPHNFNGSLCLNFRCTYANATLGNDCIVENTPYYAYAAGSGEPFINVVSRGNCVRGLYCDSVSLKCLKTKLIGESCTGDKECETNNCNEQRLCGRSADEPKHFPVFVYIIVGFCIFLAVFLTLGMLFFMHKRNRDEEREKRAQYWREQEQFRQNIMQMREQAQVSLLSLPWKDQSPRDKERDFSPSDSSQLGALYAASQPSGLRNDMSDSLHDDSPSGGRESMEEALVMRAAPPGRQDRRSKRRA